MHITDGSNPENPVYDLRPYDPDSVEHGIGWDYSEPWEKEDVVAKYPMFIKDLDVLRERAVDPKRRY